MRNNLTTNWYLSHKFNLLYISNFGYNIFIGHFYLISVEIGLRKKSPCFSLYSTTLAIT